MKLSIFHVVIFFFLQLIFACSIDGSNPKIKIGDDALVCVVISNPTWNSTETYKRAVFSVKADEFSKVSVENGEIKYFID